MIGPFPTEDDRLERENMIFENERSKNVATLWLREHEETTRKIYNEICDRDNEGRGKVLDFNELVWELDGKDVFELIELGQHSHLFNKEAKYFRFFGDEKGKILTSSEKLEFLMDLSYGDVADSASETDLPPSLVKIVRLWEE